MSIFSSHHLLSHSPFSSTLSACPSSLSHPALQASLCQWPSPLPCLLFFWLLSCSSQPDSGSWLHPWPLPTPPSAATATCTWSPCPCLALPPTCPSPACFCSGWLVSPLGVWVGQISSFYLSCWKRWKYEYPFKFRAYCLECFYQLDGSERSAWQCSPGWAFG